MKATMSTPSQVATNTLYLSLASLSGLCISFAFNIFLARAVGVTDFGEFSFVMSFITFFTILVQFSLDSVIIRDVAQDPSVAGTYFTTALALKGTLFLVAVLIIIVLTNVLNYSPKVRLLIYILSVGLLFDAIKRCCISFFEARQRMKTPAILLVAERLLFAVSGMLALILYRNVLAVVVSHVAVQAVTGLIMYLLVRRVLSIRLEPVKITACKKLVQAASKFFAVTLTAAFYTNIDKLFLFSAHSGAPVGLYAAAHKLVSIPLQFSNAFHRAIYPALATHAAQPDKVTILDTYRRSMRYLLLVAIPVGVGITIFAEPVMRATYGEAYLSATIAVQILIWAHVVEFFNPFISRVLYAMRQEPSVLKAAIVGTVSNVLLNIILIPAYSFVGAAIAAFISAILICGMLCLSVFKHLSTTSPLDFAFKPIVAGICMWIVCSSLSETRPIILAPLGILVYCNCLLLTKALSFHELLALGRIVSTWSR